MYKPPEIHEFFVEGSDLKKSHVLLHITEPSNAEELKKGYFFALTEINNGSIEQIEHLQQMIDDLESGYYETESEDKKGAFEITLEYINRRGHRILENEKSTIHCIVGVLHENNISFAYHGKPSAVLFYYAQEKIKNLNVLSDEDEDDADNEQLFSSVMEGSLKTGDFFYVVTPHVDDYFAHERIAKILDSRSTRQSTSHIQKVLKDIRNDLSFGGVVIKASEKEEQSKIPNTPIDRQGGPNESIDQMIETNEKTDEILGSPLISKLKKKIKKINQNNKNKNNKEQYNDSNRKVYFSNSMETNYRPRELEVNNNSIINSILVGLGRSVVLLCIGLYKSLIYVLKFTGKTILAIILIITNKGNRRREIILELKKDFQNRKKFIKNLPPSSKIIFVLTVFLVLFFAGSITYSRIQEQEKIRNQKYNDLISQIIEKKDLAEASILYNDNNKAYSLLQEANDLINQLPIENEDEQKKIEVIELQKQMENISKELRKVEKVAPEILADLNTFSANATKIELIDENIIAYGEEDNSFYKIDIDTKKIEQKDHSTITNLKTAAVPKENDKIIFVAGKNEIAEYNKETNTISKKEISFIDQDTSIASIFVYNRRLYTLAPEKNQIYKHGPTLGGYDKGNNWITDSNINIEDGISFAIDGDIYVLKNDGKITKLSAGQKDNFEISYIDPKLENPTKIWTYNGVENLYILEPNKQRIVVLDKKGNLVKQYKYDGWQNPNDMIIDTISGVIYIIDANKISKFNL
ncbi:MAG: hypothetical protein GF349_03835 [Candidatus Magasanikbacteria bacterium]|nr:hypothetical protein [Candidatus Magasanikbacteria bacterium]